MIIDFDIEEGKVKNNENKLVPTESHDPFIKFRIKDGTRLFDVNDRSLGFRWFFAFLLFTQFRSARDSLRPVLFLFDEPASNLHAAAQRKLVEAFPEIARDNHMLLYSTHSHYMIDPKWLEQTFIVTNRAGSPGDSVIDSALLDDTSLDIKATRYRAFIEREPNQTSYFQPIIDRLNVVPSEFDYSPPSVVLEGKSDYYILKYAQVLLLKAEPRLIPGLGAGTFEALIGISAGWGTKFLFLLDADAQGLAERQRYALNHGAREETLITLNEIEPALKEIEDLFDSEAKLIVCSSLNLQRTCKKKDILRFSQEHLAKGEVVDLGDEFRRRAGLVIDALALRLKAL